MAEKKDRKTRVAITFFLSAILFLSFAFIILAVYILCKIILGKNLLYIYNNQELDTTFLITIVVISCIILSYALTFLVSKFIMVPINKLIDGMEQLASGKYNERLKFKTLINKNPIFVDISDSFNKMATELENTETLNNDFINNFSHEFKTPIVSIQGFAKLMKKTEINREQQLEYLDIIDKESERLSKMAMNVMNLMKLENITILPTIKRYNISEQLRNCILLLEAKWAEKEIDIQVDFDEFYYSGNEELIKQVWINLYDNAIKFTPQKGTIKTSIEKQNGKIRISIQNSGSEIPEDALPHIFNKFYQADLSHNSEGSGIGLAVVKKIVSLHNGEVSAESKNNTTTFTVILPK
ncbi:MAG: HAMP domain-containing histidine kinase [Treponema sp.]|nr:HAMP domain-containing histidine kinase [Treponema sp.]